MKFKLDERDKEILAALEQNAKARMHELAKQTGFPPSTVHHRIARLEEAGVIIGWTIKQDYSKTGKGLKAYVMIFADVPLLKRTNKTQKDLAKIIRKISGVESVDIVSGDADLAAVVRCSGMKEFEKILLEKIQGTEGVIKTKTLMVITEE